MTSILKKSAAATCLAAAFVCGPAQAVPLTLEVVDSVNVNSAFGLAFDGTNI